ncbi:hypothetical protein PG993_014213 [Apiospora rasikravindrae]|uniref:Hcy-binding domain-containing protein n=1 Tax=Apiospora rasikravindrae TaxID=990691 RepID=A0ABR1RST4_9PEZI
MSLDSVRILDGGLGTSLEDRYGAVFDNSTPLWSSHFIVSDPDTLLACQRDFVQAGADVLLTATYQVSIEGFARTKVPQYPEGVPRFAIERYLANAVKIAEKAAATKNGGAQSSSSDPASLALSLGPYGACMIPGQEYSGEYDDDHSTEEALYRWHLERLRLFTNVQGLMDRITYVAFETLPRLDEIRAVRRAFHDAHMSSKKFWISCVFPGEANLLPDGTTIDDAVKGMLEPLRGGYSQPWGIGINCTKMNKLPSLISSYGQSVRKLTSHSGLGTAPCLLLYPDGTKGEVYNTTTKKWEKQSNASPEDHEEPWAKELARIVRRTQDQGVFGSFVVGGCCKASAVDISELRQEFPGPSSCT